MHKDMAAHVIAIIAKETRRDANDITLETRVEDLSITSLELVEVLMQLEDDLGVEVPLDATDAAKSLRTVGDIVTRVRDIVAQSGKGGA